MDFMMKKLVRACGISIACSALAILLALMSGDQIVLTLSVFLVALGQIAQVVIVVGSLLLSHRTGDGGEA